MTGSFLEEPPVSPRVQAAVRGRRFWVKVPVVRF